MIRFSANIKPNYTDIIRACDNGFDACSFVIKKEDMTNAGFVSRNIELARRELTEKNKEMLFVSFSLLDEKTATKEDIESAEKIAEKIGCVFCTVYDDEKVINKKSIILKNTQNMDAEAIITNILSHDFDLGLDVSALYLGSKKYLSDLELLLGTYMDRIKIIFFSDANNEMSGISIGDGNLDVKQTIAIIEKYDYKRAIVIDVDKDSQKNGMVILKKYVVNANDSIKPIRAIFFDADKTLYSIDTADAYDLMYDYISKQENASKEKIKKMHKNEIEKIKNSKNPRDRKHIYSVENIVTDKETAIKAMDIFWNEVIKNLSMFDGANKTLANIKTKYKLDIIITSDEFIDILKRKLTAVFGEYHKYFSALVTPEIVGGMKPSAKYYKYALELFNLEPSEVIVIGDSVERDLVEAKKLGITTILFKPQEVENIIDGFKKIGVLSDDNLEINDRKYADYIAKSYNDIDNILEKLVIR